MSTERKTEVSELKYRRKRTIRNRNVKKERMGRGEKNARRPSYAFAKAAQVTRTLP